MSHASTQSFDLVNHELQQVIKTHGISARAPHDLDAFMQDAAQCLLLMAHAGGVSIELIDGPEIVLRACAGDLRDYRGLHTGYKDTFSGQCIAARGMLVSTNTQTDPRCRAMACKKANAISMAVMPIIHDDNVLGVLKITSGYENAFNPQNLMSLEGISEVLARTFAEHLRPQRAFVVREQREAAQRDKLTRLYNQATFEDFLSHPAHDHACVLNVRLNDFKSITDTYGAATGEALLRAFAGRLMRLVGGDDTLAYLGGAHFGVIVAHTHEARDLTATIIDAAEDEFALPGCNVHVSASVGLCYSDIFRMTASEWLQRAKLACASVPRKGYNVHKA